MDAPFFMECSSPGDLRGALPQPLQVFTWVSFTGEARRVHPTETASHLLALLTRSLIFSSGLLPSDTILNIFNIFCLFSAFLPRQ